MSASMCLYRLRFLKSLERFGRVQALQTQRKFASTLTAIKDETETANTEAKQCSTFQSMQEERRERAERSVLISCPPKFNESKFLKLLSTHGTVKKYFFYHNSTTNAVVEFSSRNSIASLMESTRLPSGSSIPFKSRLMSLKWPDTQSPLRKVKLQDLTPPTPLDTIKKLSKKNSIDEQLQCLMDIYQLTEESISLRYLVCSLLGDLAGVYFPQSVIRPFGSTVNGLGRLGCDLDMILDLNGTYEGSQKRSSPHLEYQVKMALSERAMVQTILSVIARCLEKFGPGFGGVESIPHARCPIVRFSHETSGLSCDLTLNTFGMKSSELLFLYGQLDPRVRPLLFAVRFWAQNHGITKVVPGAWITNFSLTLMVLFFLQRRTPAILPTLNQLKDLAGPLDKCVIMNNDCTFVSDLSKISMNNNTETLETLLLEFFEFYATFDFKNLSIDIREEKPQFKPEANLFIRNPFEEDLNVSKNVNEKQLSNFVTLCQKCAWISQTQNVLKPLSGSVKEFNSPWGFVALLPEHMYTPVFATLKRKKPSVNITDLFKTLKLTKKTDANEGESVVADQA
ncbi:hypothetical protein DNTS_012393 [Danionella cerebrum]|uniref:RL domain-containing protein n=1 Tax=Danionella cerebrum TaxID=2873325 RepID=A0A553N0P4_9TELE|nr:hypothetical protein DNTS_012393 [Danionella translucida]